MHRGVKSDVVWVSFALVVTGSEDRLLIDSATCHNVDTNCVRKSLQ